ncbi:MAG: 1-acyl-sn-glycerol-3-phosphate acyltransferase [Firmicutes bacterium]|nr:1-acyl-sn-glycerol-3-phosphate acyltransferase [Bacillota bacterium]
MKKFVLWFIKMTGFPLVWIYYKMRVIYPLNEKGKRRKPRIKGGNLILSNHVRQYDPVIISTIFLLKGIWFLAAKDMFEKSKFNNWFFRNMGMIPTDRTGTNALSGMKESIRVLKKNHNLGIFPDGTISLSGEMKPFIPGAAVIASRTDPEIIPIFNFGLHGWFRRITFVIGKPFRLSDHFDLKNAKGEVIEEINNFLFERIAELKQQIPEKVLEKDRIAREKHQAKLERKKVNK